MAANAPGGINRLLKRIQHSTLDLTVCRRHYSAELCALLAKLLAKVA